MKEIPRVLALDVGDKRIGVAISDRTGMLVTPIETIHRKNMKVDVARVAKLAKEHEVALVVVGLPKNMDGTEGGQAKKARLFAKALVGDFGLSVDFEDERLSTFTATERLVERGVNTGKNRDLVDMEAAVVILQAYLDRESD